MKSSASDPLLWVLLVESHTWLSKGKLLFSTQRQCKERDATQEGQFEERQLCSSTELDIDLNKKEVGIRGEVEKVIKPSINRQLRIIFIILSECSLHVRHHAGCWSPLLCDLFLLAVYHCSTSSTRIPVCCGYCFAAPFPRLPDKFSLIYDACWTAYIQTR